jgi:hypothetical protein
MIKRVGEPYSRTLHDDEASCVDSGQFVQAGAPEIFPRPLQIASLARKDFEDARPRHPPLPRQSDIPVRVAIEKRECLDHGDRGVKPSATVVAALNCDRSKAVRWMLECSLESVRLIGLLWSRSGRGVSDEIAGASLVRRAADPVSR